ncbi:Glyoxalase/Bleomycin resistance protein/Dioxygenase superfamily protein [Solimonas aquatica]|uniref:Glyoxalase/Bleomycin resistance protein/Dioxygenase superfamily protein n=1 Tax=Solimonas aquatica TaxID=489703 RepID=A0A1H9FZK1_9GAMM|nr:VOC family protein [Solimonas aquatica]SEQ43352.1 Glyoxalase/Bleomycin resistance protein/Dioxygenase superfamily protein [Solimonas aquatica]
MIRVLHHVSLSTTDMDRFVRFYRDLLGLRLDRISPPQHIAPGRCTSCYFYDPDGNLLELQQIHAGSPIRPALGLAGGN